MGAAAFGVLARLQTGATLAQAQSDVDAIISALPGRNAHVKVISLNEAADRARQK
jgi:hypothetical protein